MSLMSLRTTLQTALQKGMEPTLSQITWYDYIPSTVTPPCAWVYLSRVEPQRAFGMGTVAQVTRKYWFRFTVLLPNSGDLIEMQQLLDNLVEGAYSLDVLLTGLSLAPDADNSPVLMNMDMGPVLFNGTPYIGLTLDFWVLATG